MRAEISDYWSATHDAINALRAPTDPQAALGIWAPKPVPGGPPLSD